MPYSNIVVLRVNLLASILFSYSPNIYIMTNSQKWSLLLVFSGTPFKVDQNKNQNHSKGKVQNLGNERR